MLKLLTSRWLWIGAAVIAALFGMAYIAKAQYDAGYAAAQADAQEATDKAVTEATRAVRNELNAVIDRKERDLQSALKVAEAIRQKQDEVTPNEIIKTVELSTCDRIGVDAMRLYNRINGRAGAGDRGSGNR